MDIILTLGFLLIFLGFEHLDNTNANSSNRNCIRIGNNVDVENVDCKNMDSNIMDKNNMDVNNVAIESVEGKSIDCNTLHKNNTENSIMDRKRIDNSRDNKIMDIDSVNSETLYSNKIDIITSTLIHRESSNQSNISNAETVNTTANVMDNNVLKVLNGQNSFSKILHSPLEPQKSMIPKDGSLTTRQIAERNSDGKMITLISVLHIVNILLTISKVISVQYRLVEPYTSKSYFHIKINSHISSHRLLSLGDKDKYLQTLFFNTGINELKDKMTKSDAFFDKQEDFQHFQWIFEPNRRFPAVFCRNFTAFPVIQLVLRRLASFRSIVYDLKSTPLSPNRLSQSGFVYNGAGTKVTCEECDNVVELSSFVRDYEMADPGDAKFHNLGCSYASNVDSRADIMTDSAPSNHDIGQSKTKITIPVTFPSVSSKHKANGLTSTPAKVQDFKILSGENTSNIHALEGSFDRQQCPETSQNSGIVHPSAPDHSRQLNTISEQAREGNESGGQGQVDSGHKSNKDTEQTPVFKVLSQPTYPTYIAYQKRLESFALWVFYHIATPLFLARAGFFYAGYADCVRCFQCGLGLRSWKVGDNVYEEHKKHRPQCPFLQAQVIGGVPTTETVHQTARPISEVSSPVIPSSNTEKLSMPLAQQSVMIPVQQDFVSYTTSDQQTNSSIVPQNTSQSSSQKSLKLKLLHDENTKLQEQQLCKVCFLAPCRDLFLPCGDLYACADCSKLLTHCPLCSKQILATVTTYLT